MKTVRIIVSGIAMGGPYLPEGTYWAPIKGQTREFSDDAAAKLIADGLAEEVKEGASDEVPSDPPGPAETQALTGAPEQQVRKRRAKTESQA